MAADRKFIPGLFVKQAKNPDFIDIGVKVADLQNFLKTAKPSATGFVNFSMAKQRNDPSKYSVWLNEYVPSGRPSGGASAPDDGTDDLPF